MCIRLYIKFFIAAKRNVRLSQWLHDVLAALAVLLHFSFIFNSFVCIACSAKLEKNGNGCHNGAATWQATHSGDSGAAVRERHVGMAATES